LPTGGVKALQDITKALEQFLTKPGMVLRDAIQTASKKTVAAVEAIIDLISTLARKLKNGAVKLFEDFKQFIDDVFKWLEEFFGVNKTVIEELADDEELFRKILIGSGGGKRFKRKELELIIAELEKRFAQFGLKIEAVTLKTHPERFKRWTSFGNNTLGSFRGFEIPPTIYLREGCTELTLQHELWHLEDWKKIGLKDYNTIADWKHEESIWEKIWRSKHRWTDEELLSSYKYYKKECSTQGVNPKLIDELETILKK
jgi:Metallopeptidase toxin 4